MTKETEKALSKKYLALADRVGELKETLPAEMREEAGALYLNFYKGLAEAAEILEAAVADLQVNSDPTTTYCNKVITRLAEIMAQAKNAEPSVENDRLQDLLTQHLGPDANTTALVFANDVALWSGQLSRSTEIMGRGARLAALLLKCETVIQPILLQLKPDLFMDALRSACATSGPISMIKPVFEEFYADCVMFGGEMTDTLAIANNRYNALIK